MNEQFLQRDVLNLHTKIEALKAQYPELEDDADLLADMIEGEFDVVRIIDRAVEAREDTRSMVEGIKAREDKLKARRERLGRRAQAMEDLIRHVMGIARKTKLETPEATVSLGTGRTSVGIASLEDLPQGMFSLERKADKAAIKKSIEAGEDVPGAFLVHGSEILTIRRG